MIYLPDTNAISAYLRGSNPVFVTRFQTGFVHARLSAIVVAEREFGFVHGSASGRQHQRFYELLSLLPVEPFTR